MSHCPLYRNHMLFCSKVSCVSVLCGGMVPTTTIVQAGGGGGYLLQPHQTGLDCGDGEDTYYWISPVSIHQFVYQTQNYKKYVYSVIKNKVLKSFIIPHLECTHWHLFCSITFRCGKRWADWTHLTRTILVEMNKEGVSVAPVLLQGQTLCLWS